MKWVTFNEGTYKDYRPKIKMKKKKDKKQLNPNDPEINKKLKKHG